MSEEHVWTHEELAEDLRTSCRVKAGDILILHSSQHAIGRVEGGVVTTVRVLKEVITPEGTLLLPVFSSPTKDGVFKIRRTPSRVGLVTEAFRRSADVKRSRHPTHSVAAWGKRRDEFLAGHEWTSALGPGSPFHRAADAGADVLMIGCTMTTLSLIHVAEALARVPYLGKVFYPGYNRPLTLVDEDGSTMEFTPRDSPTDSIAFIKVQEAMEAQGKIHHCKVGDAECLKFNALEVLNLAVQMCRADPAVLLCENPRCPVCPEARRICQEALKR
ncbi:MAG: hypothetical protein B1H04_03485 [Planctomycetales bacterium 4484_123]|nr:MAG: hypothetical protein B1H04_03485 [Planctomycetales bacterium 4484_123]